VFNGIVPCTVVVLWSSFAAVARATDPSAPFDLSAAAAAQESPDSTAFDPGDWHFTTRFGIWFLNMKGTVGARGRESDVDAGFNDLFEHLDYSFTPGFELGNGPWSLVFNGVIARLTDDVKVANEKATVSSKLQVYDAVIAYHLADYRLVTEDPDDSRSLGIDVGAGARYTYGSAKINPEAVGSFEKDESWVDPLFALRINVDLLEGVSLRNEGTIGGFGAASNLTWSAASYLDWGITPRFALNLGYRAVGWDFERGDFEWDMVLHGPWLGLSTSW
jgi:hypothetical protein